MSETLEERIRRVANDEPKGNMVTVYAADIIELLDEKEKRSPVCEVCWTSSWQPCEEGTANAVKDDSTGSWMVCECCRLSEMNRSLQAIITAKENQERIENPSYFDVEMIWKKKFDVVYGALMEVVNTFEQDGNFAGTVQAIKDELASENNPFNRYTSLEWHLWVEGKPLAGKNVLLQWETANYEAVCPWNERLSDAKFSLEVIKWAYLPDTGWIDKE